MADLNLHQSLTSQQQALINWKDLDCYVNGIHQFALEDDHLFGCNFIFRSGMPGQFPTGEWGYTLYGDMGLHIRPKPIPLDYRTTMRYGEAPRYDFKMGSLIEIIAPYTNYYRRDELTLADPKVVVQKHLAMLNKVIPDYLRYLVYKIFVGTKTKAEKGGLKTWFETYIEPSDGANNGYPFYQHQGYGEVNLSKVITKEDRKQHDLKTRLEVINAALRNDNRKIEVDKTQNAVIKTVGPKQNLTDGAQRTFALYDAVKQFARKVLKQGNFGDVKYKHKNDANHWEGIMPRVRDSGGLIALFNKDKWQELMDQFEMSAPTTKFFDPSNFPGRLIITDLVDDDEAILMQSDLIQIWILPQLVRYGAYNYDNPGENTRDFIYEMAHSLDMVNIFSSAYFKLKA